MLKMSAKSSVFEHFDMPDGREGMYKARCKYCSILISASGKTTSNLLTHIKRKHPGHYPPTVKRKRDDSDTCNQMSINSYPSEAKKHITNDSRQSLITKSITLFVAGTLQSLSIVETDEFIDMIKSIDPKVAIPSRKHLSTNLLTEMYSNIHGLITKKLTEASELSLTINIWSNKNMKNFMAIAVHFISNWKLDTAILACKRFKGQRNANNIVALYEEIINDFDISRKVTHITTNNSSNMIKVFGIPGYNEDGTIPVVREACSSDSETDTENQVDSNDSSDNMFEFFSKRAGCFAQALQLVVKDGLKEAANLTKVVSKASAIVSYIQKSADATDFLQNFKKHQTNITIKWNTELKIIRLLLDIPQNNIDELNTVQKLSLYERNLLKDLCDVLSPFETATDYMQGNQIITSSFVIPCIRGLKTQLVLMNKRYDIHSNNKVQIISAFMESMEKHFIAYELSTDFKMAAILDPRFKLAWCQDEEAASLRVILLNEAASYTPVQKDPQSSTLDSTKRQFKLFNFVKQKYTDSSNRESIADEEITRYLSDSCLSEDADPLKYWEVHYTSMPVLAQLALKYLVIPATSAPVERLFNVAGRVFKPHKCRLTDKKFENLMFIRCNKHFIP